MGGFGSGQGRGIVPTRKTVESSTSISVTQLRESGVFTSGEKVEWSQWPGGGLLRQVAVRAVMDQALVIVAVYLGAHGQPQVAEATVRLAWSDCHFGGRRPWFLCPALNDQVPCERRVTKLHLSPGGSFLCRQCAALDYKSDHVLSWQRPLLRAQKILRRLGGSGSLGDGFPDRPKGMHFDIWDSSRRRAHNHLDAYARGGYAYMKERGGPPAPPEEMGRGEEMGHSIDASTGAEAQRTDDEGQTGSDTAGTT